MRVLALVLVLASTAHAGDLCARDAPHRGATIDLDVKGADIHDVLRVIADVAHINLVVSDEVSGKVTLRLKHVAWDLAACAIAGTHHLQMTVQDNILMVTSSVAGSRASPHSDR